MATMTQSNFEQIAKVIRERRENLQNLNKLEWSIHDIEIGLAALDDLAMHLEYELSLDNKKFDGWKFLLACGLEGIE